MEDFILKNAAHIYVIEASDGSVKVGVSKDPECRIKNIRNGSGKEIVKKYYTDACSNAYEIESQIKREFEDCSIIGEWFNCDFSNIKERVEELYSSNASHYYISKEEYELQINKKIEMFKQLIVPYDADLKKKLYKIIDNTLVTLYGFRFVSDYFNDEYGDDVDSTLTYILCWLPRIRHLFYEEDYDLLMKYLDEENFNDLFYDILYKGA